jgi:hypothetical protein
MALWGRRAHIEGMVTNLLRRRLIGLAIAMLTSLMVVAATGALGQTNTQTIQQTLGNFRQLPLASEPYQRSSDDQLYRQQLRDQALQGQEQAAQTQQQLIDQSGSQLQQNLQAQRQHDVLIQQQSEAYRVQSLQQSLRLKQQH